MATLKSLVDETTNIKNELVECHTNLKNNLIEKGVDCSDTDKLPVLINKIANIQTIKKSTVGTSATLYQSKPSAYATIIPTSGTGTLIDWISCVKGGIKVIVRVAGGNVGYEHTIKLVHYRDSKIIYESENESISTSSITNKTYNIENVEMYDRILCTVKSTGGGCYWEYAKIQCKFI